MQTVAVLGRIVVDESDRGEAELWVLEQLLGDHSARVAGAGDQDATVALIEAASVVRPTLRQPRDRARRATTRRRSRGNAIAAAVSALSMTRMPIGTRAAVIPESGRTITPITNEAPVPRSQATSRFSRSAMLAYRHNHR